MNLKWTKERPKINGLYWHAHAYGVSIYEVSMPRDPEGSAEAYIMYMGTELFDEKFPEGGYWMGPIPRPKAPKV